MQLTLLPTLRLIFDRGRLMELLPLPHDGLTSVDELAGAAGAELAFLSERCLVALPWQGDGEKEDKVEAEVAGVGASGGQPPSAVIRLTLQQEGWALDASLPPVAIRIPNAEPQVLPPLCPISPISPSSSRPLHPP